MGYTKDTDWVEYRITIPDKLPEKMERIAEIVLKKYQLRIVKYTSRKKLAEKYGEDLFRLINDAYADLYGYSPLTDKQIDYYIDMYLGFLKLDYVSIVVDSADRLVGVGISMPSMTKALQKSGGMTGRPHAHSREARVSVQGSELALLLRPVQPLHTRRREVCRDQPRA